MQKLDNLVQDFLAQKKIAVVGVSDKRDTGCNLVYKKILESRYQVYGVNPRISTYEDRPCYPDLSSLPERVDAVFILASPRVTEQIVQQCVELGIKHMRMFGFMNVNETFRTSKKTPTCVGVFLLAASLLVSTLNRPVSGTDLKLR